VTEYVRRYYLDTWHWMPECQHFRATKDMASTKRQELPEGERPASGELCNECLGKEKARASRG
jgi:hypothetical protein